MFFTGQEHLPYENRLEIWGSSAWRSESYRGTFQYLTRAYRKDVEGLFIRAGCDRTRGNGFKLEEGRFRVDIRKKFFTVRVVRHWNSCPKRLRMPPPWKHSRPGWMEL